MKDLEELSLRLVYFDIQGRAEPIRSFFNANQISFEDIRLPIDDEFSKWRSYKEEHAGWHFQKLPVLRVDDFSICEALTICQFLDQKFRPALLTVERLEHSMLQSSIYQDIVVNLGLLIWSDLAMPGLSLEVFAPQSLSRVSQHWQTIDHFLNKHPKMILQSKLYLTDFCILEAMRMTEYIFGDAIDWSKCSELFRLREGVLQRTGGNKGSTKQFTARPNERGFIDKLRTYL